MRSIATIIVLIGGGFTLGWAIGEGKTAASVILSVGLTVVVMMEVILIILDDLIADLIAEIRRIMR
jgi:hypothetical protein